MTSQRPVSLTNSVVIVDILREGYGLAAVLLEWVWLRATTACPACGVVGAMGLHACYAKYHYGGIRRPLLRPSGVRAS